MRVNSPVCVVKSQCFSQRLKDLSTILSKFVNSFCLRIKRNAKKGEFILLYTANLINLSNI